MLKKSNSWRKVILYAISLNWREHQLILLKNEREVKINYILDTIIEIRNELKYVKEQLEAIQKNTEETNETLHYNFCEMARMFNDTTEKIIKEIVKWIKRKISSLKEQLFSNKVCTFWRKEGKYE